MSDKCREAAEEISKIVARYYHQQEAGHEPDQEGVIEEIHSITFRALGGLHQCCGCGYPMPVSKWNPDGVECEQCADEYRRDMEQERRDIDRGRW